MPRAGLDAAASARPVLTFRADMQRPFRDKAALSEGTGANTRRPADHPADTLIAVFRLNRWDRSTSLCLCGGNERPATRTCTTQGGAQAQTHEERKQTNIGPARTRTEPIERY